MPRTLNSGAARVQGAGPRAKPKAPFRARTDADLSRALRALHMLADGATRAQAAAAVGASATAVGQWASGINCRAALLAFERERGPLELPRGRRPKSAPDANTTLT